MPLREHSAEIARRLGEALNRGGEVTGIEATGGGSINSTYRFYFGGRSFFLKENSASQFPQMFEKESRGLKALARCKGLVIPELVAQFAVGDEQYLVLEHLEKAPSTVSYREALGRGVVALHQMTSGRFGFDEDNYIGSLPQSNKWAGSWAEFFAERRLQPLVRWCSEQKLFGPAQLKAFDNLCAKLPELFPQEPPALLHGDLWGGNAMSTTKGPSVYDPAVYYGHREMDLAMTRLFGGFDQAFYDAYNDHYPLEKGAEQRADICNLYPLLVHVKLFGGGYLQDVLRIIKKF